MSLMCMSKVFLLYSDSFPQVRQYHSSEWHGFYCKAIYDCADLPTVYF